MASQHVRRRARQRQRLLLGAVVLIALILIALIILLVWLFTRGGTDTPGDDTKPTVATIAGLSTGNTTASTTTTAAPTTTTAPSIADSGEDGYMSEGLYIWDNKAFELFYGGTESAKEYAELISSFKAYLPNARVYNMVVPNHSEFGLPERLRDDLYCASQRETTAAVYSSYTADIQAVDIYDVLNLHKNEYLYYNTDTHWASLGAYYAYTKFCEVAGVQAMDISRMEKTSEEFLGYLYTITEEPCLDAHPDHVDLYEPPVNYTAYIAYDSVSFAEKSGVNSAGSYGYLKFAWGDTPLMKIVNHDGHTGRKVLIVKDSYGNAMVPFLVSSFDETHVVDFRHFERNLSAYCTENGITDVLFFNNVMSAHNPYQWDSMQSLFD